MPDPQVQDLGAIHGVEDLGAISASPAAPTSDLPSLRQWLSTGRDVGVGVLKGAGRTALDVGQMAVSMADPSGTAQKMYQPYIDKAKAALEYQNTPQTVGGMAEGAAELALPLVKGAEAVPTTAKAAAKFSEVMSAAAKTPVDISAPGNVALRIQQLAENGGTMPQAVRKFLLRVTDPGKPPLTYDDARDFASNISRLSADEYGRLTPVIGREVANLRVALNQAVGQAASAAGKGQQYAQAMTDYARAMKLRGYFDSAIEGLKKSAPYATAAGASYYLSKKLGDLFTGY